MKKTLRWVLFFSLHSSGFAQEGVVDYLRKFAPIAIREMEQSGIPASVKLGQGILESAYGNSPLAQVANNHFGIKCGKDWSGEIFHYDDDRLGECFRKYDTPWHSFRDHSKFLKKPRYSELFSLSGDDYKSWAKGLKRAGYATAEDYAERLIARIEEYQLWRLDKESAHGLENRMDRLLSDMGLTGSSLSLQNRLSPQDRIRHHENDQLKYIVVEEGETLGKISQIYGVSVKRLMRYNDLSMDQFLVPGQYLFLERKNRSGATRFYKVAEGENMYIVSQKTGIRLEKLYYRNRMEAGDQARPGDILYLQGRKNKPK